MKGFLLILLLAITSNVFSESNRSMIVYINGYLINLGGVLIFQPTEDSVNNPFEVLDWRSFEIGNMKNTNYFDEKSIDNIDDSTIVHVVDGKDTLLMACSYFFCQIKLNLDIWNLSNGLKMKIYKKCKYEILFNNKVYLLDGCWISNMILSVKPSNKKISDHINNYYIKNGLSRPDWLKQMNY